MDKDEADSSPNLPEPSCDMDRNPSPPTSDDEGQTEDSIGSTVYSKHWFFTTLTRLIQLVAGKEKPRGEEEEDEEDKEMALEEDMENDICKVWDMSMNEEVALFLMEFNAPEIFLGVISKSKCSRVTEICVGILGNMACFQEPRAAITEDQDLGEVLLLLMGDTDPPTLLETTRPYLEYCVQFRHPNFKTTSRYCSYPRDELPGWLLLTCVSQADVRSAWMERIRNCPSARENLCFIMSSSTNGDLLGKVGELVDKMFDADEDLMTDWIRAGRPKQESAKNEERTVTLGLVRSLLEAAKQLKHDSPEGLDVYMHILQLVTTVDEGVQAIVQRPEDGRQTWEFLSDLTCRDLCQPGDPPLILQEQKTILSSVLAVMSVVFESQTEPEYTAIGKNLSLISSLIRISENLDACQKTTEGQQRSDPDQASEDDVHLQILRDVCCEFLANVLSHVTKENVLQALKEGQIPEEKSLCTLQNLLPLYAANVNSFIEVLGEVDQTLSETLKKEMADR